MSSEMHALLRRQLKRHAPVGDAARGPWLRFIAAVDDAYKQFDEDRAMLERSLELSSEELLQSNAELTEMVQARRRAERTLARQAAELARSNDELQQFAYVASHDLQEPLRTVQSYLQLLQRRYADQLDGDANEFIDFAVSGAQRMRQLIQDLLAYARVTSRAKAAQPVALAETVKQVTASLHAAIEERDAAITHDPLPTVLADAGQMRQLLQNLLSNAMKFTDGRPPRIHITARPLDAVPITDTTGGRRWEIAVRDNGIGIAADLMDKIFIIFKRLHARDEYEGTGIGLAICRKIVERHGGALSVQSQPGEGSTFLFDLEGAADALPSKAKAVNP